MNREKLRSPATVTFKNPKMSLRIGENLEVQPKTNTQKIFPNWVYGWLGEVSFAVENKIGNLNKIRLFKVNKWDIPLPPI